MALPSIPVSQLTSTGLVLSTQAQWQAYFTALFQSLYGADVVLTADSPDGQLMNLFIQAVIDNQELTQQAFTSFDPDQAFGTTLDQRQGLRGLVRLGGTYSLVYITVTTTQALTLYGLNQNTNPVYTISDAAGNQWNLQATLSAASGANTNVVFQAANPGPVNASPAALTTQVTISPGVTSVTNPSAPYFVGKAEETDSAFKLRGKLSQQGYFTNLYTALSNVSGVSSINIYENDTGSTVNGVTAHSIWVIVGGNATAAAIGQAIYQNRSAGCGMVGAQGYTVTRPDGSTFVVNWDVVAAQTMYVAMFCQAIDGKTAPLVSSIATLLSSSASYTTTGTWSSGGQSMVVASATGIAIGQSIVGTGLASNSIVTGVSGTTISFSPVATGNGSAQSVVFSSSGLLAPGVGQSVNVNQLATLVQQIDPNSLVTFASNAYMPFAGGFSLSPTGFTNTLAPSALNDQLSVSTANTWVYPMIVQGTGVVVAVSGAAVTTTVTVAHTGTLQLSTVGGAANYTYTLTTNNSGGSCTSGGLYTAGASHPVSDIVTVTDANGQTATITISVT